MIGVVVLLQSFPKKFNYSQSAHFGFDLFVVVVVFSFHVFLTAPLADSNNC